MSFAVIARAAGMFAVANVDDILILALFFAQVATRRRGVPIVVVGQYLGFAGMITYVVVFLVLVGVWCVAGHFLATRPPVARSLARWGHVVLPVVLIGIGLVILVEGGVLVV